MSFIIFIAQGGAEVEEGILLAKNKIGGSIYLIIVGILSIAFGFAMFFIANLSMVFIGVALAIDGAASLIGVIIFSIQTRQIKKEMLENVDIVEIIA